MRVRRMRKAIIFQVNRKHDAQTRNTACRGALAHDKAVLQSFEHTAVEVLFHCAIYVFDTLVLVLVFEIRFGENEFERTLFIADILFELFPVTPLGRKLIACDDRPFVVVAIIWDKNIARSYCFHLNLPFLRILPPILRFA